MSSGGKHSLALTRSKPPSLALAVLTKILSRGSRNRQALLFLAVLGSFVNLLIRRVQAPKLKGRKVLFLGPGCGHAAYSMGFVDALLADDCIRETIKSTNALFGGVSSGAQAAVCGLAALHGPLGIQDWYKLLVRPGYEALKRHSPFGPFMMGKFLFEGGAAFVEKCKEHQISLPLADEIVVSCTGLSLRPIFATRFSSLQELSDAAMISSYVPFVMGRRPWYWLVGCGRRAFDGYLGLWRARLPDNYMYIAFIPNMPSFVVGTKNFLPMHEYDTTPDSLAVRCYPWGDLEWADAGFERGRNDFMAAAPELRDMVLAFLRS